MKAVRAAADMRMEDLIMVTVFTADMQEFASLNKIYSSHFDSLSVYPGRAAVGISALAKNARVELTAIAILQAVRSGHRQAQGAAARASGTGSRIARWLKRVVSESRMGASLLPG
jgi:hypothetical protein